MKKTTIYFPGLNGIRAVAAFLVCISHFDEWSHYFNLKSTGYYQNQSMAPHAVVMFFVLSGFLISYLLFTEKEKYKDIQLKKFYIRRILRIWPVYYIVLTVGTLLAISYQSYLVWYGKDIGTTFLFYLFFIPNLVWNFGYKAEIFGVLWSVGAEEQFYAIWPVIVKRINNIIRPLIVFLFSFLALKYILITYVQSEIKFHKFFHFMSFDQMAIGAIAAWLCHKRHKFLSVLYHPATQIVCWLFLIVSIITGPIKLPPVESFEKNYHAIVYAILVVNVATNPKTLISLENRVFNFLGKISYGIYAYHFTVLFLLSLALKNYMPLIESDWLKRVIMFGGGIGGTILVSYLSFRFIESWFLKKKEKFMLIKSSNTGKIFIRDKQESVLELNNAGN